MRSVLALHVAVRFVDRLFCKRWRSGGSLLRANSRKEVHLDPVHSNIGVEVAYRKSLYRLINAMNTNVRAEIERCWRTAPPLVSTMAAAQDSDGFELLRLALRLLAQRWEANFDLAAHVIARSFAGSNKRATEFSMQTVLRRAGWSIPFKLTPAVQETYDAVVAENVSLIKSIPEQYMKSVEGAVWRGVASGGDLKSIVDTIMETKQVTRHRAAFIARDQNNKARASFENTHRLELGMKEAIWLHSHAGKVPRPSHLAFDKHRYELTKGAFLDGKWVWPGTEPNCRCVSRGIIPGVND